MASIDRAKIAELMEQAEDLQHGPTQIALLEEAVRLADLLVDVPLAFEARSKLIEAANFGGSPEKAMIAFTWCLAQLDRDPQRFSVMDTLWRYKWVIGSLPAFPQLSRSQILGALDDLRGRIEKAGYGTRPVHKLRSALARDMGDVEEYHSAHTSWMKSHQSVLSDCSACDLSSEIEYLADIEKDKKALIRADPILSGISRCEEEPHCTLAIVLLPLVRLGRLEEAVAYHQKGYRLISRSRHLLHRVAQHVEFLALTDNLARGVKLFETHLPWALVTFDLLDRFRFSLASRFLFDRLQKSGKKTIKLRLPSTFPLFEESGKYGLPEVIAWLESDAAGLARRFDDRNGNGFCTSKVEAHRALEALVTPFPLKKPSRGKAGPDA